MADLLFDRLGLSCLAFVELDRDLQVGLNLNVKQEASCAVILPLTK